jgi:Xaa-Pro dipeptidase
MSGELAAARMCKSAAEIAAIAAAAAAASAGQDALRAAAAPGVSGAELWRAASSAMEKVAGAEVEALCDLLIGARSAEVDGQPGPEQAMLGDPVLFDLAPRLHGYWADSCATFALGRPSPALRALHDSVRFALEAGIAAARPGVKAGEVDAAVRARLDEDGLACPHHSGHGVGFAAQEPPWLVPGDETRLDEGMTIAIETGAYGDGIGARLEHLVLIEADGARLLTTHSVGLSATDLA